MKFLKKLSFLVICVIFSSVFVFAHDTPLAPEQLPAEVTAFVKANFPKQTIIYAEHEYNYEFELRLDDGSKVEVLKTGELKKAENKMKGIPASLIPAEITAYVTKNYPNTIITEVDKKGFGYKIELNNGLEMMFGQNGNFMGFDD